MKNKYYTSRDPIKNYFPLPNEVFALGLSPGALAVYSYLMYIEDRTTYQCHASYRNDWERSQYESEHRAKICCGAGRTRANSDRAHKHYHAGWSQAKREPFVYAPAHSVLHPAVLRAETCKIGRGVSRNASESAWKRSNWRSRKPPVHQREPRVAAVSDFPGTARRVPTGSPKPDVAPPCGSDRKFDRSPAQRVQSKEEMRQTWNTPKWEEFGDFGRRGEKAG